MGTTLRIDDTHVVQSCRRADKRRRKPAAILLVTCLALIAIDCAFGQVCRDLLGWVLAQHKLMSSIKDIAAGSVAGLAGLLLVYPLDTAKTRLQIGNAAPGQASTFGVIWTTAMKHGAGALYRGVLSPAVGMGIIFGTTFGTYNITLSFLDNDEAAGGSHPMWHLMIAGFCSGVTSSVPRSAFEKVKSMMQAERLGLPQYKNVRECAAAVVNMEGLLGPFTSLHIMIYREGPQQFFYFPIFETARRLLLSAGLASVLPSALLLLLPGALAGMLTWLPPFFMVDVVLSRHQTAPAHLRRGFLGTAQQIYKEEGAKRFFRGLPAALSRAALMHGVVFLVQRSLVEYFTT